MTLKACPWCGGRVLTVTMTADEERRFAAAYRCQQCQQRMLVTWEQAGLASGKPHRAIEEK